MAGLETGNLYGALFQPGGNKRGLMFSLGDFGASELGVLSWLFFLPHFITDVCLLLV